jgi:single-stranded DNA-binding protein
MTQDEIKSVIHDVLAEQNHDHDQVVLRTIAAILTSFGIEEEDRKEIRADFIHLRKWRKSVEQAQSYTFKAVITVIATGLVGALWMGIKAALGK